MSRAVLISGATKGIGRALAQRLAERGHTVIGIARTGDATFPGELRTADLSDRDATSSALQDISSTYRIDAVVNNVGLVRPQMLEQVTLDALDAVLDVNLRPAIQLTQAALPGMRQQGWGRVVNIASLVALGAPQRTAYAAAKAALISCTRGWALELAPPRPPQGDRLPAVRRRVFHHRSDPVRRWRRVDRTAAGLTTFRRGQRQHRDGDTVRRRSTRSLSSPLPRDPRRGLPARADATHQSAAGFSRTTATP
jgi:hypothetical protein